MLHPKKRAEGAKSVREMQSAARARLFTAVDGLQGVGVEVGGGWSHMLQTRFSQAEGVPPGSTIQMPGRTQ